MSEQVKLIDLIDALLINGLLLVVLALSIGHAQLLPKLITVSAPEEVVMQAVALSEISRPKAVKPVKPPKPPVVEPRKIVPPIPLPKKTVVDFKKVVEKPLKPKTEPVQPKTEKVKKINNEKKNKGDCLDDSVDDNSKNSNQRCKKTKPQLAQERRALEQKRIEEANRKARENAEQKQQQKQQQIAEAKRKAKQIDEQKRLAKASEQKKKIEKPKAPVEVATAKVAKPSAKEERKRQAIAAQKAEAAEAKKTAKAAANAKAREATAAAKREAAAAAGQRQAAEEAAKRRAEAAQSAANNKGLIAQVRGRIHARVRGQWVRPAGTTGLSCTILIRLVPGGAVGSAQITRSSGNAAFDSSALGAVRRASPLPVPNEVFSSFRQISLTLK